MTQQDAAGAWSERVIATGSFRTRFVEAGNAGSPTVLLLHDGAWGGSASVSWGNIIPILASSYHVLAPDLLGYGGSDKAIFLDRAPFEPRIAQIEFFLHSLRVDSAVHVVGNSFGGGLALRALAGGAIAMRSIVSIAGAGGRWRPPSAIAELGRWDGSRGDLSRILSLLIDPFEGFERHLDDRLKSAKTPGHYRALMAASVSLPEPLKQRPDDPWPRQVAGDPTPVMLVRGQRDVLLQPEWAEELNGVLPNSVVVDVEGRHSPNIDHAANLAEVIAKFHAEIL